MNVNIQSRGRLWWSLWREYSRYCNYIDTLEYFTGDTMEKTAYLLKVSKRSNSTR